MQHQTCARLNGRLDGRHAQADTHDWASIIDTARAMEAYRPGAAEAAVSPNSSSKHTCSCAAATSMHASSDPGLELRCSTGQCPWALLCMCLRCRRLADRGAITLPAGGELPACPERRACRQDLPHAPVPHRLLPTASAQPCQSAGASHFAAVTTCKGRDPDAAPSLAQ